VGLPISWLSHLPQGSKERAEFESLVRNSTQVLSRLRDILTKKLETYEAFEEDPELYLSPSVTHSIAFYGGAKRSLKDILLLLDFMDK
jgi:hypothetical protein